MTDHLKKNHPNGDDGAMLGMISWLGLIARWQRLQYFLLLYVNIHASNDK